MTGVDYSDGRQARKSSSILTEVCIIGSAILIGWFFYDGLLSINQILHLVGLR